jgi:hypothetical protein
MKQWKFYMLAVAAVMSANFVYAQSADDIINRYLDSLGGKDKIGQVNSLYMEATSQIMGNDAPVTVNMINGKDYKSETEFNGQKIVRCYTEKGGWTINPFMGGDGAVAMTDQEYNSVKGDLFIGGALYNYAANHVGKAELQGKEDSTYKIVLTDPDSLVTTYYIDTANYLLTKMVRTGEMQGQQVDVTTTFSDYKKTDAGVAFPFSTNIDFGGNFSMATTLTKVDFTKTIDPAIFEMPK